MMFSTAKPSSFDVFFGKLHRKPLEAGNEKDAELGEALKEMLQVGCQPNIRTANTPSATVGCCLP